ncbi:MAG: FAD-dependent oxidoreductase [Deltaproteobacteria bacterium]|nr:FAD-dependent oxidoreductase [Deltaproteobacteria bacterium]MBT4640538.1 FAD-dependent oxidoreductase [Deltaproteobacteria bacterium]MBT6499162.1 FAD-dependent oxidoreductase [Deltaproteobacteria bacterium]MBT6612245.1 FAD-dependent oxidoreductase [Deltaproteobacteria bacterium]MBT7713979.1 FAD-dependent oxidoreductase [Deltaproteobacteria bacterium]
MSEKWLTEQQRKTAVIYDIDVAVVGGGTAGCVAARKRAIELSRFMQKYIPGFENAYIVDTGAQTMPRHIRNIEADYPLTEEVLTQNEACDDAVYVTAYGHQPGTACQIPYGIMIPRQVENLLVAGKCTDGAHLIRSIPSMMAMGQAAGTAAAPSAREVVSPRQLSIEQLQRTLREQSVILNLPQE